MATTHTRERDYVPDANHDGGKKRMSRARKGLIGLVVLGAVGAVAGGGSFATFTASTDNRSAAAPFESQNNMVLANTVADGTVGTQCRSDEATGGFVEENIAADAVRCEVLFTSAEVDALAAGTEISALVALENLSLDGAVGIPGTLMWSSVDERFAGCVGFDDAGPGGADGTDGIFFTGDDNYILPGDGGYAGTLCDNIALTIQEVAVEGDRGDTGPRDYTALPRNFDTDTFVPIDLPAAACVFPAAAADCATDPAADQRASGLPLDFDPVQTIDAAMEADDNAALNDYQGVRVFRITANLIGDTICTIGNDADANGIIDATGIGCSNGAGGFAAFTLRWVLQEN